MLYAPSCETMAQMRSQGYSRFGKWRVISKAHFLWHRDRRILGHLPGTWWLNRHLTEPVSTQQRRLSPRRVGHSRTNLWHRSSNQACFISPFTHINPLQPYPHHPLLSNIFPSFQVKYLPADKVPDRETTTKTGCSKTYQQACSSCHATS